MATQIIHNSVPLIRLVVPASGLNNTSSGLTISTIKDNEAVPVSFSGSDIETITLLGTYEEPTTNKCRFSIVSSTLHPNLYEIHLPYERLSFGGNRLVVTVTVPNVAPTHYEIDLECPSRLKAIEETFLGSMILDALVVNRIEVNNTSGTAVSLSSTGGHAIHLLSTLTGTGSGVIAVTGSTAENVFAAAGKNLTDATVIPAATMRSYLGMSSANLDTQLSDIPTVSEFNARTLPSADYFLVSDYTPPANSDVTAIKAKTDQLTFTVAGQVDANALSGGSGLDAAGVRSAIGLASANLDTQLSAVASEASLEIVNNGVKNASLLVPHTTSI
jgi:hypothetical protein